MKFSSKDEARQWVWEEMKSRKVGAFPFPLKGRIPNFKGAADAARRVMELPLVGSAAILKINPDSPQRKIREEALKAGKTVFVPTPRLREGFLKLDPKKIPREKFREASTMTSAAKWGERVPLSEFPQVDVIVTGSVAVTLGGKRCGKGHGYGDIEFSILRELGHDPVPVVTTVHDVQVVEDFPVKSHDLPVSVVVTPTACHEISRPPEAPGGIQWDLLPDNALEEMPVLKELRDRR